jgi:hypothetical protein
MVIQELKRALEEVKTLQGFIPICASCKKIGTTKVIGIRLNTISKPL